MMVKSPPDYIIIDLVSSPILNGLCKKMNKNPVPFINNYRYFCLQISGG